MDAHNVKGFVSNEAQAYWKDVDLYIGGSEHATGHLLYSRFWNKILFDLGFVNEAEPFKKLVNQGMIQGRSNYVYRVIGSNKFVSKNLIKDFDTTEMHVDVNIVENDILNLEAFKNWRPDLAEAEFVLEDGKYTCGYEVEKMSKSKYNVVSPDDIIEKYGTDTLRMYEMFLGPLEQFKPWNTHGIDGVSKFLRKLWRLYHMNNDTFEISEEKPNNEELKVLHKAIKKVSEDIEGLSLNTSVSTMMIAVNELTTLKCNKREVLENLALILSPFAPHIAEELWEKLGHSGGISIAEYPQHDESYLVEASHEYPISINGKVRVKMSFAIDKPKAEIEAEVLAHEVVLKWTEVKPPKKMIVVPQRIINVVI
jgi:leucyl-tRNA synthetase